jgi:O-antigen/teichoic acid export membrane protein
VPFLFAGGPSSSTLHFEDDCRQDGVDIPPDCLHIHAVKLWRSGIFISIVYFFGGLGNYAFQGVIKRQMSWAEFGYTNSALKLVELLGLPLAIISSSLVHYIAHFRAKDDDARLQGLVSGYQRFLFRATIGGSLLAIGLAAPLTRYFDFPRWSVSIAALACVLMGMWSGYAVALCQGMAWFKRMAIIGLIAVALRLLFGWLMTKQYGIAEIGVTATTFSLLANLVLFVWRKDIFRKGEQASPWDAEFRTFMIVTAGVIGGTFFFQADQLVAQKYFSKEAIGTYAAAGKLSQSLVMVVGPLLTVLFTSRSGHKSDSAHTDQKILLLLYGGGLLCGAAGILYFRQLFIRLLVNTDSPSVSEMMIPYTIAMVFFGLSQAIGMWSLASRWFRLAILYGVLGLAYFLALLVLGKTPEQLLSVMPYASAGCFLVLCIGWLVQLRAGNQSRSAVA